MPYSRKRMLKFAGNYVTTRYPHRTFAKLLKIWESVHVSLWEEGGEGGILFAGTKYIEVAPMHFQEKDDVNFMYPQIAFRSHHFQELLTHYREDNQGHIIYMMFDQHALERIGWYDGKTFLYICLSIFGFIFAIYPTIMAGHVIYWWRKRRELSKIQFYRRINFVDEEEKAGLFSPKGIVLCGRISATVACTLNWVFGVGMFQYLWHSNVWTHHISTWGIVLLILPSVSTALAVVMFVLCFVFFLWPRKFSVYVTGVEIIAFITLTGVLGLFAAFVYHWNFLGLKD